MEGKTNFKMSKFPDVDKMRLKFKNYINSDYVYINSSNISKYNYIYELVKEITIIGVERSFGIHRNEWFLISAYHKSDAIIKSRSWYCFFMNNYFNISLSVIGDEMNLTTSGVKYYIRNVAEDYSIQGRKDYNKVLDNIFKTESDLKFGW